MTHDWNTAQSLIFPRVGPPDAAQTGLCVTPELGVELVLRDGGDPIVVTHEHLLDWGVSPVTAAAIAVENLRTIADDDIDWLELPQAPFLYALYAEDGDAASRLLVLEDLIDVPLSGVLVAVPTRGQLICLPLTHYEVLDDLPAMVIGAQLAARANRNALSTQLFFFDGKSWTTLAVEDTPGEAQIYPSPGFAAALEVLVSQSLAPLVAEA
ncbi:MAG: hypothetical protein KC912_14915 [Proteobacteria bacterium]|nr:hypothetical protein [Pseudomonadota bacterium]